ncbi:hypothetical protein QOT17_015096 [Balamuthia mandrillaris]
MNGKIFLVCLLLASLACFAVASKKCSREKMTRIASLVEEVHEMCQTGYQNAACKNTLKNYYDLVEECGASNNNAVREIEEQKRMLKSRNIIE